MAEPFRFWVPGRPQTAGSKSAFVNPKTGKAIVTESGSAESKARKRTWRGDLRDAAEEAKPEGWSLEGAKEIDVTIVRRRPASQLRSGKHAGEVKDWAKPLLPVAAPDTTKVLRAFEDALSGVLWHDDAAITDQRARKRFADQAGLSPLAEGLICEVRACSPSDASASLASVPDQKELSHDAA